MTPRFEQSFGIYIHWPFCAAKCPYCDFNSHVRGDVDEAAFTDALILELQYFQARSSQRRVSSVFFGGGTPSLMTPRTVARLIDAIASGWAMADTVEITLEANPTSVEADRFSGFRSAGVNRVSIGVQSLKNSDLARLGRTHSVDEALGAIDVAARHFERFSFDLIYGREGQNVEDWRSELKRALALAPEHLSAYQLTIEPATPFFALQEAGRLRLPGEEVERELFDATHEICAAHGLPAYEVSNFARPGSECRHNLTYWRTHDYVGVGPGAHGRLTLEGAKQAFVAISNPERWRTQVIASGHGGARPLQLTRSEMADELLLMGLRLAEGIDLNRLETLGMTLGQSEIRALAQAGLVACDHTRNILKVTPQGWPVLNAIIARLAGGGA